MMIPLILLLILLLQEVPTVVFSSSSSIFAPVTDPNLVFSLYNWDINNNTTARTSNPGASLKFSVTNSTSVGIVLDTSTLASNGNGPCVSIATVLNDQPWVYTLPTPGNGSYLLSLSTTLDPATVTTVKLYLHASCEQEDRWLYTSSNSFLVITGVQMDMYGSTVPLTLITLPHNILVYGDSISEGTNAQNYDYVNGRCGGTTGLRVSSSMDSWAYSFCSSLTAECSLVAFAAQGYVTKNSYNYGNVPPFLTLANDEASAWNKVFSNTSRIPSLLQNVPTLIMNALGFNDQNNDVDPTVLTATITAWLNTTRTLFRNCNNNSSVPILAVLTPFGGEMRTNNVTRNAIISGYTNYINTVGKNDLCTLLIDLYPYTQLGLQGLGLPTAESCDGTHPLARAAAYVGSMAGSYTKQAILQSNCPFKF